MPQTQAYKTVYHSLKIVDELTRSGTLVWKKMSPTLLLAEMGPFEVTLQIQHPYSEQEPHFNLHAFDGCNGYNFGFHIPEVARLYKLVLRSI